MVAKQQCPGIYQKAFWVLQWIGLADGCACVRFAYIASQSLIFRNWCCIFVSEIPQDAVNVLCKICCPMLPLFSLSVLFQFVQPYFLNISRSLRFRFQHICNNVAVGLTRIVEASPHSTLRTRKPLNKQPHVDWLNGSTTWFMADQSCPL